MRRIYNFIVIAIGLAAVLVLFYLLPNFEINYLSYWPFLVIIAAFVVAALMGKNIWWLLLLAPPSLVFGQLMIFKLGGGWSYEVSFAEVFIALVFIFTLINRDLRRRLWEKVKNNNFFWVFAVYLAFSVATYFYTIYDIHFFVGMNKIIFFGWLSFVLALTYFDDYKKISYCVTSLAAAAILLAAQVFYKFYQYGLSNQLFTGRSTIVLPFGAIALVTAALAMIIPILIAFYYSMDKSRDRWRLFILFSIIIASLAVFLILGKAAIISLALGLFYLLTKMRNRRVGIILFGLLFVVICFTLLTPYFVALLERFSTIFNDVNWESRLTEYGMSWKLFQMHYLTGIGTGQEPAYFDRVFNYAYYKSAGYSLLTAMAVDLGVAGLALLALLIGLVVKEYRKLTQAVLTEKSFVIYGFIASLIVVIANGFFAEATIYVMTYSLIFWSILGIYFNLKSLDKK